MNNLWLLKLALYINCELFPRRLQRDKTICDTFYELFIFSIQKANIADILVIEVKIVYIFVKPGLSRFIYLLNFAGVIFWPSCCFRIISLFDLERFVGNGIINIWKFSIASNYHEVERFSLHLCLASFHLETIIALNSSCLIHQVIKCVVLSVCLRFRALSHQSVVLFRLSSFSFTNVEQFFMLLLCSLY